MKTRMNKTLQTAFRNALFLAAGFMIVPAAHADFYLETTFLPSYTQSNTGLSPLGGDFGSGTVGTESGFSFDLHTTVGYIFSGVLVGFSYNFANAPLSRAAASDADSLDRSTTTTEMGASVGYLLGKFRFVGTYLFAGTKKRSETQVSASSTVDANFTLENKGGQGYQFILAYDFNLSNNLKIGPSLLYRHVSYSSQTQNNILNPALSYTDKAFTTDAVDSYLEPMISLTFQF